MARRLSTSLRVACRSLRAGSLPRHSGTWPALPVLGDDRPPDRDSLLAAAASSARRGGPVLRRVTEGAVVLECRALPSASYRATLVLHRRRSPLCSSRQRDARSHGCAPGTGGSHGETGAHEVLSRRSRSRPSRKQSPGAGSNPYSRIWTPRRGTSMPSSSSRKSRIAVNEWLACSRVPRSATYPADCGPSTVGGGVRSGRHSTPRRFRFGFWQPGRGWAKARPAR